MTKYLHKEFCKVRVELFPLNGQILGACILYQLSKLACIKELHFQLRSKVLVCKLWWVVVLHELNIIRFS